MRTNDKPIIASCNMFSSFLIFCSNFTCLKTRKFAKYDKLGKYFPYSIRYCVITSKY